MKVQVLGCLVALAVGIEGARNKVSTSMPRPTERALLRDRGRDCVQDACFSELQASAQCGCTRMANLDCSSYLITAVTPDTSTVYETASFFTTQSDIESVTATSVTTELVTAITDESSTTTATVTSTQPVNPLNRKKVKRYVERNIPGYASVCGGRAGYESACDCIGVRSTVTFLPTPLVTVTVSTTYSTTDVESTTVSTETITTAETTTSTSVPVETATATAVAIGPFYITADSNDMSEPAAGLYATTNYGNSQSSMLSFNQMFSGAEFYLDPEGNLRPVDAPFDDAYVVYWDNPGEGYLYVRPKAAALQSGFSLFKCELNANGILDCGIGSTAGLDTWISCSQNAGFAKSSVPGACGQIWVTAFSSNNGNGCQGKCRLL